MKKIIISLVVASIILPLTELLAGWSTSTDASPEAGSSPYQYGAQYTSVWDNGWSWGASGTVEWGYDPYGSGGSWPAEIDRSVWVENSTGSGTYLVNDTIFGYSAQCSFSVNDVDHSFAEAYISDLYCFRKATAIRN